MSTNPGLESLVNQTVSVITNDGRLIVGTLRGFDQATNIILDESHERVYSTREGVQQLALGLYIIRGDNISVIGEFDEGLDLANDLSEIKHKAQRRRLIAAHRFVELEFKRELDVLKILSSRNLKEIRGKEV